MENHQQGRSYKGRRICSDDQAPNQINGKELYFPGTEYCQRNYGKKSGEGSNGCSCERLSYRKGNKSIYIPAFGVPYVLPYPIENDNGIVEGVSNDGKNCGNGGS